MAREHVYELSLTWTGNTGSGTSSYRSYGRDHMVEAPEAPAILGSSDPAFRGDPTRWNPEQLFLASVANCHMLWYLHLASAAGVTVLAYRDEPTAVMTEDDGGGGEFTAITLRPHVTIDATSDPRVATSVHDDVGAYCFIARSIRVPIHHVPMTEIASAAG